MKTIYLVRHGQTLFNKLNKVQGCSDSPLTETGARRAAELGARFKKEGIVFDAAFTSDLGRARQTAKLILSHSASPDVPLVETADLREVGFGMFEGGPNNLMWQRVSEETGDLVISGDSPDELKVRGLDILKKLDSAGLAESYGDVRKRVAEVLNLLAASKQSAVLAVSHGLFINCLLFSLLDRDKRVSSIPNTSVTKLVYDNGTFTVHYIGQIENL